MYTIYKSTLTMSKTLDQDQVQHLNKQTDKRWYSYMLSLLQYNMGLDERNLSSGFANNKGAYQPAHLSSLIRAYVIRFFGKFQIYKRNSNFLAFLCGWGDWFMSRL